MPKKQRITYILKKKLKVAKFAEKNGTAAAVKKFKIHRNQILRWMKDINLMESKINKHSKVVTRRRSMQFPELEVELLKYATEKGSPCTKIALRDQALSLAARMNIKKFKCSDNWIHCFIKRNGLVLSAVSNF